MKEPCDMCGTNPWERIKFGKFVCGTCEPPLDGFPTYNGLSNYRVLGKGTHWETKIKVSEEREIKRQVAIPLGNGKFTTGRRGENGKIQEKHIKT